MPSAPRWGYTGLTLGLFVALGSCLLYQLGWLAAWDGGFYDRLHSWTAGWRDPKPRVLLVGLEQEDEFSEAEALKALDLLETLGARAVVFNSVPRTAPREFFRRAAELKNVVFGRRILPDPDNPDVSRIEPCFDAARGLDLPWGVVFLPRGVKGVHREQQAYVPVGSNTFPTLETRAAALAYPSSKTRVSTGRFLVNFAGGPGRIPNVSLPRVLNGQLVGEMVNGKVVLVGRDDTFLGLETPVSAGARPMSFLEFQGSVVQTLLDGTPIRPLSWPALLLVLVGLGLGSALAHQRMNSVAGVRLVLLIILLCGVAAAAAMMLFGFWICLGVLILAQTAQYALSLVLKTRITNLALKDMRLHALRQIKERFCPPEAQLSAEDWDHLAGMIKQTLDVERMVFFERVPQTEQLQEAKVFNCGWEDVLEKGPTLETPIFSECLAKGAPVRVQGFLSPGQVLEDEYLCPLIFAGETLGAWIVSIDAANALSIPHIEVALMKFSQQIARLLYHRKLASTARTMAARLKAWVSTEKEDRTHQELKSTAELLQRYYDILEAVFGQIGAATIVYDFFGRVLKANDLSVTLLRPENFMPTKASAAEFLRLVTGKDDAQVRRLLRSVLLEHTPASLQVKLPSKGDRQFLLRLNPLFEQEQARSGPAPSTVRGLICELIETTSLSTLASLKGLVADRLSVELRDHLAAIEMSASLLESESFAAAERQMMLDVIHQKTDACVHVITECQKYLGRAVDAHTIHCFPVDALELLRHGWGQVAQIATERLVTLKVHQPPLMAQVLASTADLTHLFSIVFELLLKDAAENTPLTVKIVDAAHLLNIRFSNCGFGIPDERLQEILANPESPAPDEFQVLRKALVWVRNWGGSLEISSQVGKGYTVILRLRQFELVPPPPVPTTSENGSLSVLDATRAAQAPATRPQSTSPPQLEPGPTGSHG